MGAGFAGLGDVRAAGVGSAFPGGLDGRDAGGAEADHRAFGPDSGSFGDEEDRTGNAVSDRVRFVHVASPPEWREQRVIERGGAREIGNFEDDVVNHSRQANGDATKREPDRWRVVEGGRAER